MNIETVEVKVNGDPSFLVNCYLVSSTPTSDSVIVIDPGDEPQRILGKIGTRKVLGIVCTHGHLDHVSAASELARQTGADIYLHADDAQWSKELYEAVRSFIELTKGPIESHAPEVDKFLTVDEPLQLGDLEFSVIHTPGHTPGSVCLYHAEDAVLFSGDTLFRFTCGRTDFPYSSPEKMGKSLARLAQLPPDTTVYPGHYGTTTIGAEINRGLSEY